MSRSRTVIVAALALVIMVPYAASAASDVDRSLPIHQVNGFVVDRLHGHLLVAADTGLQLLDSHGQPVTTLIPSGVQDVSVAPDGHTAWASDGNEIYRIDLDARTASPALATVGNESFSSIAAVNSRYVAVTAFESDSATVFLLDTRTGSRIGVGGWGPGPGTDNIVRAIPETNDIVTMTDLGVVTIYDVGVRPAKVVGAPRQLPSCTHVEDLTIASDGHSMIPLCADQPATQLIQYALPDLAILTTYPLPPLPLPSNVGNAHLTGAAFSLDGSYLGVGLADDIGHDFDLLHKTSGHWTGIYGKDFPTSTTVAPHGVQLSNDGTTAYVLSQSGAEVRLHTLSASPTTLPQPRSYLTIAAASVAGVVVVSGSLRFTDDSTPSLAAGRPITITRTLGGHTITVPETLDAAGNYRFLNHPTSSGVATYTVTFTGDQLHTGSSASTTVNVSL